MTSSPPPFARFEWLIAWRYLRARRAEGGVSTMTWISLIGITLAVFALVVTLAVRAGLRADFVQAMLGANAHVEVLYSPEYIPEQTIEGQVIPARQGDALIRDYDALAQRLEAVPGVLDAAPLVRAQVMGSHKGRNAPVDVYGITLTDLMDYPMVAGADRATGDLARFDQGIAMGSALARQLGLGVGDKVKLISPDGVRTAMGRSPRVSVYEVVYVFSAGQQFVDQSRVYMPLAAAQDFFNRADAVDQIDLRLVDPENLQGTVPEIAQVARPRGYVWTWADRFGSMLRALQMQDNAIFVVLGIVVLIAALNIVSGLIMLVKNKGRDIGILRTMGLSQGSVLRVFFLCGAWVGTFGTLFGMGLGVVFCLNIDSVYGLINAVSGNGVRDLEASGFLFPSALLRPQDMAGAAALSLGLSWLVTLFPARRAARLNPIEALRYE
ncbi:MAG: ABC transporter permease [Marinibacterium sp.]|nr:ABC transporter permease [Marinibacterium sp.]